MPNLRKKWSDERDYNPAHPTSSFLTGAQDSHLQRVTISDAAQIQLDLLKTSSVLLETCRGYS